MFSPFPRFRFIVEFDWPWKSCQQEYRRHKCRLCITSGGPYVNMVFNADKFELIRYWPKLGTKPETPTLTLRATLYRIREI